MGSPILTHDAQKFDEPPAGSVEVPVGHWLEVRVWRTPEGARFVQLVDESEPTWQSYCRMIAARSQRNAQVPPAPQNPVCIFP